jgi:hypothetical protein
MVIVVLLNVNPMVIVLHDITHILLDKLKHVLHYETKRVGFLKTQEQ